MSVKSLLLFNKLFKLPVHPFNMQNDGVMSYSMWQYNKGIDTIKFYLMHTDCDTMFKDKDVLDIGCGAGGKSLYYLSLGAKSVTGIDVVEKYEKEAYALQDELGLSGFKFLVEDASKMSFEDNSFDTIVMNDAMEHVAQPDKVLEEVYRVLKPGGKLYVNFPPYNHPFGAHLSDVVGIPWVHLFFSDKTLIKGYKELVKDLPDGKDRINFRISETPDGEEYFSYINKMTVKKFDKLIKNTKFNREFYAEIPLRNFLKPLCKIPFTNDCFIKMVVSVLTK